MKTKRIAIASLTVVSAAMGTVVLAQDSLLGTYSGNVSVMRNNGPATVAVHLSIVQVEGGSANATMKWFGWGACKGEYALSGPYKSERLELQNKEDSRGCNFKINLSRDGNKLAGTATIGTGQSNPIELSR